MARVADHMSRNLLTVERYGLLSEAARRMADRGVGAALVVESDRLVGILTERDVMKAVGAGVNESGRVRDWMTGDPETVAPDETTDHAAALMIHGGFRHLPVVEGDRLVGILSIRDLMRVQLEDTSPRGA